MNGDYCTVYKYVKHHALRGYFLWFKHYHQCLSWNKWQFKFQFINTNTMYLDILLGYCHYSVDRSQQMNIDRITTRTGISTGSDILWKKEELLLDALRSRFCRRLRPPCVLRSNSSTSAFCRSSSATFSARSCSLRSCKQLQGLTAFPGSHVVLVKKFQNFLRSQTVFPGVCCNQAAVKFKDKQQLLQEKCSKTY